MAVRAVNLGDVEVVELDELMPKRKELVSDGGQEADSSDADSSDAV